MKSNLEILLGEWGAWQRGDNVQGLGAPSRAAFVALHVDGQRRSDPYAFLVDDDLRRVDGIINAAHPDLRAVLIAHYVWTGITKSKIERLRISRTYFYQQLDFAHQHVAHAMGGKYATQPKIILSGHLAEMSG